MTKEEKIRNKELADKTAREEGYDVAVFEKRWKGYDVYYGDFTDGKVRYYGLPYYMLVKNGKIRLSTADEKCELCGLTPITDPNYDGQTFEEIMAELEVEG